MSQKSLRREGGETKKNTVNDTKASSSANQSQDVDCYNQVAPKGVPMAVPALPAPPSNQQPRREQCVVISIFCIVHTECTQLRCSALALAWSGHVLHCRSCHQQGLPAQGSVGLRHIKTDCSGCMFNSTAWRCSNCYLSRCEFVHWKGLLVS